MHLQMFCLVREPHFFINSKSYYTYLDYCGVYEYYCGSNVLFLSISWTVHLYQPDCA